MIKREIKEKIKDSLERIYDISVSLEDLDLEIPADKSHGDYSANICFRLAGEVGKSPKEIASEVAKDIKNDLFICESKNGFLNFRLTDSALEKMVKKVLKFETEKREKTMVLDYSSPNIAKSFGIGHLRSTIVGQAIYNIYEYSGWNCVGINHLGDWGTQYGKLLYQIKEKDLNPKELSVKDLEKLYVDFHKRAEKNPEMEEEGKRWFKKLEDGDPEATQIWEICVEKSMREFEKIYDLLNVEIDHHIGESFYQDKMEAVIEEAKEKGVAKESKGALIVDFGDEIPPAMLLKSDGGTTYFTRDLATVKYRVDRWDPELFIYEIGADQKLHMRQLFKTVEMLGWKSESDFMHVAHGMYRLKDGAMSTRKGKTIHLEDVLNEAMKRAEKIIDESETTGEITEKEKKKIAEKVGVGAVKYADLKKHYKKDIVFDWEKAFSLKGNSGPYLQYTALRAKSVLDKHDEKFKLEINKLSDPEKAVLKEIILFDEVMETAEKNFTPSSIANFSYRVAKKFNAFYAEKPILEADTEEEKIQRLSITKAGFEVLKKSLSILGIDLPERM